MRAALLTAVLLLLPPIAAQGGESIAPPPRLSAFGQELVLNGYGAWKVLGMPVYVCALYVATAGTPADEVIDRRTPVALRLQVLRGDLPEDLPRKWKARIGPELDAGQMQALKAAYAELGAGDVVFIAYAPGRGTTIAINERLVLSDPGYGLMTAFLGVWLGPEPESDDLRQALLAGPEP